jgi:Family of unknown function (DUF6169)
MSSEAHPSLPQYDFLFVGGLFNSYVFQTKHGITYEVTFKSSGYLFEQHTLLRENTFEFSVLVAENLTGKTPPSDRLIPATIARIFSDFFQHKEQVVVYICDTSDGRASVRNRKFNQWFDWYKGTTFIKIDMQLGEDANGQTYFTAMILRTDHPNLGEVVSTFRDFIISQEK